MTDDTPAQPQVQFHPPPLPTRSSTRNYSRGLTTSTGPPRTARRTSSITMASTINDDGDEEAASTSTLATTGGGGGDGSGLAPAINNNNAGGGGSFSSNASSNPRQPPSRQHSRRIRWIPTVVELSNTVANLAHRNDRLRQGPSGRGLMAFLRGDTSGSFNAGAAGAGAGGGGAAGGAAAAGGGIGGGRRSSSLHYAASSLGVSGFGRRPLHDAWALSLADLKALVKAHRDDLNVMDSSGSTPLMYFAEMATVDHALLLLDYGADIEIADFNGANALSRASAAGRNDMVLALYEWVEEHAQPTDRSLVLWAVNEGQMVLMDTLLQQAALDVDWVIEESNRHTALHIATLKGYTELMEVLLRHKADMTLADVNSNTPLHLALLDRNLEASKLLIRSGAPLNQPNRSNKVPMDLCAETMTLSEFMHLVQESYDTMVALVVPFILRTSMSDKHDILADLVAGQVETHAPEDQALCDDNSDDGGGEEEVKGGGGKWGRGEEEEDDEGEDIDPSTPETVIGGGTPTTTGGEEEEEDDPPPSLGDIGKRKGARAIKGLSNTFQVRHDFSTDVFAANTSRVETWEALLVEEYGSPAENLFWTLFYTKREGRNLLLTYLKNLDPVGVTFVVASYGVCLVLAFLALLGFASAIAVAIVVVLLYVTLAQVLWLSWRYGLSPLIHNCWAGARWLTSWGDDMGLTAAAGGGAGIATARGGAPSPHHQLATPHRLLRRGRHALPRFLSAFYHRYSPSYVTAWIISSFYCQWEVLRSTRHRRTTHVASHWVKIQDVCDAEPGGLLAPLIAFNVPSYIYGIDTVQAVIDYKFRTVARAVLKTELAIYCMLLASFTAYLSYVHDPNSSIYKDPTLDWDRLVYRNEHLLAGITLLLLFRIFRLEIINLYRCLMGWSSLTLSAWSSSIWTWMNVLGFPLFLYSLLAGPKHLISHLMASVAFILWWKSLYFLKGFRATGPLVQTVTKTFTEIRWFILLLGIIIFGFGSCFITLFREDAAEHASRARHGNGDDNNYDWATPASVFLSLLSILLGNFTPSDFTDSKVSTIAIVFLVVYILLVVIVMLNLLIAIVSTVYDQLQASHSHEFLRAKAELICEVEQQFFLDKTDLQWFPKKLYYIRKIPSHQHHQQDGQWGANHPRHSSGGGGDGGGGRGAGSKDQPAANRSSSRSIGKQQQQQQESPQRQGQDSQRWNGGSSSTNNHAPWWQLRYRGTAGQQQQQHYGRRGGSGGGWVTSGNRSGVGCRGGGGDGVVEQLSNQVELLTRLQWESGRRHKDLEKQLGQAVDILRALQQQHQQQGEAGVAATLSPPPKLVAPVQVQAGGKRQAAVGGASSSSRVQPQQQQAQRRPPPLRSPSEVALAGGDGGGPGMIMNNLQQQQQQQQQLGVDLVIAGGGDNDHTEVVAPPPSVLAWIKATSAASSSNSSTTTTTNMAAASSSRGGGGGSTLTPIASATSSMEGGGDDEEAVSSPLSRNGEPHLLLSPSPVRVAGGGGKDKAPRAVQQAPSPPPPSPPVI